MQGMPADEWWLYRIGDIVKDREQPEDMAQVYRTSFPRSSLAVAYVEATSRAMDWPSLARIVSDRLFPARGVAPADRASAASDVDTGALGLGPDLAADVLEGRVGLVQLRLGDAMVPKYRRGAAVYFYENATAYEGVSRALSRRGVGRIMLAATAHRPRILRAKDTEAYVASMKRVFQDARLLTGRNPDEDFFLLACAKWLVPPRESGYVFATQMVKILHGPVLLEQEADEDTDASPPPFRRKAGAQLADLPQLSGDSVALGSVASHQRGSRMGVTIMFPRLGRKHPVAQGLPTIVSRVAKPVYWKMYGMLLKPTAKRLLPLQRGLLADADHTAFVHLRSSRIVREGKERDAASRLQGLAHPLGYPATAYEEVAAALTQRGVTRVVLAVALEATDELAHYRDTIVAMDASDVGLYAAHVAHVFRVAGMDVRGLTGGRRLEEDLLVFLHCRYFVPAPRSGLSTMAMMLRTRQRPNLVERLW